MEEERADALEVATQETEKRETQKKSQKGKSQIVSRILLFPRGDFLKGFQNYRADGGRFTFFYNNNVYKFACDVISWFRRYGRKNTGP